MCTCACMAVWLDLGARRSAILDVHLQLWQSQAGAAGESLLRGEPVPGEFGMELFWGCCCLLTTGVNYVQVPSFGECPVSSGDLDTFIHAHKDHPLSREGSW